ncbi:MAG: indolepyruvate ferredoxin oxidoreductase subunit alpha, partial [Planctomycetes bacterium]|nr:indolepyruvate ferredoxin oxidoreductase subunit alpha [Planctomycetota bacterium]
MKVDERFLTEQGPEIFTGNELLLKGALETEGGVHLLGGYPGSPVAGFFDAIRLAKDLLNAKGIRAVINNNEALAAAMLNGSQLADCRAMIVIKSVGVHVAADALALGNLAGASSKGGAIVVYGDDPWSDSTQVPADSRFISKHLFIPTIEPSTPQEVKDFIDLGFKLSASSELFVGYVLTTNLADGGGTVICKPNHYPHLSTKQRMVLESEAIDLDKRVLLPPKTWWQEATLPERHRRAVLNARQLGFNKVIYPSDGPDKKEVGFITSGLACAYLLQALAEMDLLGEFPILKFGMSYPIDAELVEQFAQNCQQIIVVEERRGFLEEQVAQVITLARQRNHPAGNVRLWGKRFPDGLEGIPSERGLHPSILIERIGKFLKSIFDKKTRGLRGKDGFEGAEDGESQDNLLVRQISAINREMEIIQQTEQVDVGPLPVRLPTFCPGCPHRDTANVCLEIKKRFMDADYMKRVHNRGPVDLVFHGDTGCYTMLMYPPNTPLMHDYSGMGLGGGTGAGVDPFITNKQVVFMGDSTFFHSGQVAISQAVKLGQDITFIVLDNRTTAMTGHQPTPGVEYDVVGNPTPIQDIEQVIRGIIPSTDAIIVRVNPERREEYRRLLEKTFLADGVKVIIADKECGITQNRRKK